MQKNIWPKVGTRDLREIGKRSMNISSTGIASGFADPSASSGSEGGRAAAGPGDASSDVMLMGGYDEAEIPDGMGSLVGMFQATRVGGSSAHSFSLKVAGTVSGADASAKLNEDQELVFLTKFKTATCNTYKRGKMCPFDKCCLFAHGVNELRRCPFELGSSTIIYCATLCPSVQSGGECDHAYCVYSKNLTESLYHPERYKTKICTNFQRGRCFREASCAFIHERSQRAPDTAPISPSAASPIRAARSPIKVNKSSSGLHSHSASGVVSFERTAALHPPCYVNFIPGLQSAADFGAGAAGKGWVWLPARSDEKEQGQPSPHTSSMMPVFASLIQKCEGCINVVVGINPAEPIQGVLLKAAAVDLPRLKAMCEAFTQALTQCKTRANGMCTGRIDVHEVEQSPAISGSAASVYIAELCVTEAAQGSAGPAVDFHHTALAASSSTHNFAQPLHPLTSMLRYEPPLQQHHSLHTLPTQDYSRAFPPNRRGLGLGFADAGASVGAAAVTAPRTWQTSQLPFAAFDGPASLVPWSWGGGSEGGL